MKNFVWVGLCILAIAFSLTLGGLIADRPGNQQPQLKEALHAPPSTLIHEVKVEPIRAIIAHSSAASSSSAPPTRKPHAQNTSTHSQPVAAEKPGSNTGEIDPELVDRAVQPPFSQIVKEQLVGEGDKERFRRFATADTKDDWNLTMEHQLYDSIISHPLAKLITIESIKCKAGICELQLYEQDNDTWTRVANDLGNQPWWDFQTFSTYTFVAMVDLRRRNANYVLLSRTP
jgi:hypothetical protein